VADVRGAGRDGDVPMTIRIAILNDFDVVVAGLSAMLESYEDLEVVDVKVGDLEVSVNADVALYDTYGRSTPPNEALQSLVDQPCARNVAVFTFNFDPQLVAYALAAGVRGYVWKGLPRDEVAAALRHVAAGEIVVAAPDPNSPRGSLPEIAAVHEWGLTSREGEVLALLTEGASNAQIASALFVSVETIRSHVKQVYRKLGVHTRSQATSLVLRGAGGPDRATG
jgi:DNA-binding NarL/FixJ family response regulator